MENKYTYTAKIATADKAVRKIETQLNNAKASAGLVGYRAALEVHAAHATTPISKIKRDSGASSDALVNALVIVGRLAVSHYCEAVPTTVEARKWFELRRGVTSLLTNSKRYGTDKATILKRVGGADDLETALAWIEKIKRAASKDSDDNQKTTRTTDAVLAEATKLIERAATKGDASDAAIAALRAAMDKI